jgi:fibronectin-binding autotransporter adhesin
MKLISNTIKQLLLLAVLAAVTPAFAAGTIYQWKGGTSSAWGLAGNWSATGGTITGGPAPTNGLYGTTRLQVTNNLSTGFELLYDAANGTTIYSNTVDRALVIGSGANGRMRITGGTFSTAGNTSLDVIGNSATGILIVDGTGNFISPSLQFGAGSGSGGSGFLYVSNGTATITTLAYNHLNSGTAGAIVELAGGTLTVSNITKTSTSPYNLFNFNGGTLKPFNASPAFFPGYAIRANVRNGGAKIDTAGFNITISQSLLHSTNAGDAVIDGGLTKNGNGVLTLPYTNNYTGPTVVNAGSLVELLPLTSSGLTLANGTTFNPVLTNSPWFMASAALTNATVGFNYGSWPVNSYTNAVYAVTNLAVSGSITCNITGTGFPITNLTLLSYVTKTGGGSFVLGSLPAGAVASIVDTGSSIVLQITSASIQNLVWSGGDGIWQTNGGLDWNSGTAQYLEYPSGVNDTVTFNDTSSGAVNINSQVNPSGVTVSIPTSYYTFNGAGSIGGTNGITFSGGGTLTINNSNNFTGPVALTGGGSGSLYVGNSYALGATNGVVTISGPTNTLLIGTVSGAGITVSNKTVTISGTGIGGAKGALRGAPVSSGNNIWAGPVIIGSNNARIGADDNGNLTVSGNITDNGLGYGIVFRPGASATVTVSGSGNNWSGVTTIFGQASGGSVVKLGAANAIPGSSELDIGVCTFDLNGFNQASRVLNLASSGAAANSILTDSGAPATFTLNATNANSSFPGDVTGSLALVKNGSNTLTLTGANLTYTGITTVSQGQLNLWSPNAMASAITVSGGATLGLTNSTTGSLTLNANSILSLAAGMPITVGSLNASASPLNISFTVIPAAGSDTLLATATGGITGSAGNFQVLGARSGTFYLANGNTELHYIAPASSTTLTWKGNDSVNPTFWDITTTTNWNNAGNPDKFYTGDFVVFDDSAVGTNVVIQTGGVVPSSVTFSNNSLAYTVSGAAIGGNTLTKTGSGQVTLAAANSYSGATTVNNGILTVQNNSALGSAAAGVFVTNSGALDLGGALAANALNLGTKQITIAGSGFGGNGTLINNSANSQINAVQKLTLADNSAIGGPGITLTNTGLTSSGPGRWDMRGTGNTLDMGGFNLMKAGSNYVALVATTVNNPGNITINGGALAIQTSTALGGSSANTLTVNSNGVLELYQVATAPAWSLVLNTNSTVWSESGTGAQNTWAGPVTVNGPATLQADGVVAISGPVELNANVTFNGTVNTMNVSGSITGPGSITEIGAHTLTLAVSNGYTGGTVLNGGYLLLGNASALGTGGLIINSNALRLAITDGLTVSNNITINGAAGITGTGLIENSGTGNAVLSGGSITINGTPPVGGHFSNSGGGSLTVADPITATVPVTQRTGTVIFSGGGTCTNIWLSGTTILGANNGLSTIATVDLGWSGADTLDLAGFNQTLSGITRNTANGAVITNSSTINNSTLTITGTSSYPGLIKDTGVAGSQIALNVNGGNLTLSGANTYSGGTTVTNGTLAINNNAAAGTGVVAVNNAGTLAGNGTVSGSTTMSAGSTLAPGNGGVGTLTFSGNLTLAGNVLIEVNKSLAQSNDLASVTGTLSNTGAGVLTVTNLGTNALVVGDYFKVFNKAVTGGNTLTIAGPVGVTFTNNLAVDGSISVLTVPPTTPPTLNFANLGGNQLQFTWTGTGILQSQTNNLSSGLSTNWGDYPGGGTSGVTVTIDPSQGSVFFRVKQ